MITFYVSGGGGGGGVGAATAFAVLRRGREQRVARGKGVGATGIGSGSLLERRVTWAASVRPLPQQRAAAEAGLCASLSRVLMGCLGPVPHQRRSRQWEKLWNGCAIIPYSWESGLVCHREGRGG